jgi:hypothetical protein
MKLQKNLAKVKTGGESKWNCGGGGGGVQCRKAALDRKQIPKWTT